MKFIDKDALKTLWTEGIVGFAFVDLEGCILEANPYFCSFLEFSESELIGKHFRKFTHPDDVSTDEGLLRDVILDKIPEYFLYKRYITKTGKVKWVVLHVDPVYGIDGDLKVLLAQIVPVDRNSSLKPEAAVQVHPIRRVTVADIGAGLAVFLKNNWRWVLPLTSSVVTGCYMIYQQIKETIATSVAQSESIKAISETLEKQAEVIKALTESLSK